MLAHPTWVERGRRGRVGGERELGPRWWRDAVEWKGVQSISHKSVCTARSPNAATLSSYSFDRDPLGLCTQSLMALFKDRNRSMPWPGGASATKGRERANERERMRNENHALLYRVSCGNESEGKRDRARKSTQPSGVLTFKLVARSTSVYFDILSTFVRHFQLSLSPSVVLGDIGEYVTTVGASSTRGIRDGSRDASSIIASRARPERPRDHISIMIYGSTLRACMCLRGFAERPAATRKALNRLRDGRRYVATRQIRLWLRLA